MNKHRFRLWLHIQFGLQSTEADWGLLHSSYCLNPGGNFIIPVDIGQTVFKVTFKSLNLCFFQGYLHGDSMAYWLVKYLIQMVWLTIKGWKNVSEPERRLAWKGGETLTVNECIHKLYSVNTLQFHGIGFHHLELHGLSAHMPEEKIFW